LPDADSQLKLDDEVVLLTHQKQLNDLRERFGAKKPNAKR
jgi:hypothetical protein